MGPHILQVGRGILVKANLRVAAVIHGRKDQILALLHILHLLSMFLSGTLHLQSQVVKM